LQFLFLCNAIQLLTFYINYRFLTFFLNYTPRLVWSLDFFEFSIGPCYNLYILSLTYNNFKIKPIHSLLFVPFLVFAYLCFTRIVILNPTTIRYIVARDVFLTIKGYLITYGVLRTMNLTLATISILNYLNIKNMSKASIITCNDLNSIGFFTFLLGFTVVFIFESFKYIYFFKTNKYLQLTDTISLLSLLYLIA